MARYASTKQLGFLRKLIDEKRLTDDEYTRYNNAIDPSLTGQQASRMIDTLMALPRKSAAVVREPRRDAPEGMHRLSDGKIYKVQRAVHGSGNLYAKRLDVTVLCTGHLDESAYPSAFDAPLVYCADANECPNRWVEAEFVYARGAMRLLSESTRMTLDDAKAFGALYNTCCACGRTLTDETSVENGIGPICAKRFM